MQATPDGNNAPNPNLDKDMYVTFVLDETGSMESIKDDTVGGFNAYLANLKKFNRIVNFTLIKFDSNRHEIVHASQPVGAVPPLTNETYQPGAMTPLIDAIMKAIIATEEKVLHSDLLVAFTVQTDGYENASTQYNNLQLAQKIKEKAAEGWLFTFLGAGIDAFSQAGSLGFVAAHTLNYGREKSGEAFEAASRSVSAFAASDGDQVAASFTVDERTSAVGPDQCILPEDCKSEPGREEKHTSLVDDVHIP
jgi:hypothetical protein